MKSYDVYGLKIKIKLIKYTSVAFYLLKLVVSKYFK